MPCMMMMENSVKRPMVPPTRLIWFVSFISVSLSISSKEAVTKKIRTSLRVDSNPIKLLKEYQQLFPEENLAIVIDCLVISICCSFKFKVLGIVSLKFPVLVHQTMWTQRRKLRRGWRKRIPYRAQAFPQCLQWKLRQTSPEIRIIWPEKSVNIM